tara:strand:+ start:1618 stop:2226 length:609 start_codon:yes stop_codon:yes gene_type:complete
MAKPKASKNPPSGNKTPDGSIIQITNALVPVSLNDQLKKLKLDAESKIKAANQAQSEVFKGMSSSEEQESDQETQLEDRIQWLKDRIIEDREIKEKEKKAIKEKKLKKIEINNPSPSEITSELGKGVCTVWFGRKTYPQGVTRRMTCTLDESKFDGKYRGQSPSRSRKPGLIPVWDLDASNWRSFYLGSVTRLVRNEETDVE